MRPRLHAKAWPTAGFKPPASLHPAGQCLSADLTFMQAIFEQFLGRFWEQLIQESWGDEGLVTEAVTSVVNHSTVVPFLPITGKNDQAVQSQTSCWLNFINVPLGWRLTDVANFLFDKSVDEAVLIASLFSIYLWPFVHHLYQHDLWHNCAFEVWYLRLLVFSLQRR